MRLHSEFKTDGLLKIATKDTRNPGRFGRFRSGVNLKSFGISEHLLIWESPTKCRKETKPIITEHDFIIQADRLRDDRDKLGWTITIHPNRMCGLDQGIPYRTKTRSQAAEKRHRNSRPSLCASSQARSIAGNLVRTHNAFNQFPILRQFVKLELRCCFVKPSCPFRFHMVSWTSEWMWYDKTGGIGNGIWRKVTKLSTDQSSSTFKSEMTQNCIVFLHFKA
jgi:hypothetical protein